MGKDAWAPTKLTVKTAGSIGESLEPVSRIANRDHVGGRIVKFYESLAGSGAGES